MTINCIGESRRKVCCGFGKRRSSTCKVIELEARLRQDSAQQIDELRTKFGENELNLNGKSEALIEEPRADGSVEAAHIVQWKGRREAQQE